MLPSRLAGVLGLTFPLSCSLVVSYCTGEIHIWAPCPGIKVSMCVLSDLENTSSMRGPWKACRKACTATGWVRSVYIAGVRTPGSQETKDCLKKGGCVKVVSTILLPPLASPPCSHLFNIFLQSLSAILSQSFTCKDVFPHSGEGFTLTSLSLPQPF